ncbi:hypothetical protein LINPERPRIM_LOCUS39704, partial [Linum perenne]
ALARTPKEPTHKRTLRIYTGISIPIIELEGVHFSSDLRIWLETVSIFQTTENADNSSKFHAPCSII